MTESYVLSLAQDAVSITLLLAGPVLLVSLLIGSLVSLVQAATSINEATMTFVPKIIGIVAVLLLLGSWMLQQILVFTTNLFNSLPGLAH
ncbi:MAG TPA: flagellar biosynthetic protein FliQ [Anaerolinea thermolimosa]|uniref:Flagellar biosynthetic protein FliQ n=1 Tax=Anaerolinea thermolimosa TaxID=229919 RepID=A0A3D1JCF8_9CHLR|nr:flagellar biosynthesis protein FliQ [Anaerolinea thermolimosa]GAP07914.1 flagellar biosynthetic protein FliQ [Anaerolinea thermolimosa]HCE16269.1 flagellar biosynthetic protein FliQ [Anaerolinea thermolimosa]